MADQFEQGGYKAGQKQQWDSVAPAWRKWWPSIEKGAGSASEALASAIDAKPGDRILDISTGIGEPAVTLAKIVGSDGSITATDQSPEMLAVARERISEEGLENIQLLESDTEQLAFPEGEFDGAVCRWGLMFLPDLQGGLRNILRSLKPGARFAGVVWGTPDQVPFASLPMAVAQQVLSPPPAPPPAGAPNLFVLGQAGALESALTTAGFRNVTGHQLNIGFQLDSSRQYCEWLNDLTPPIRAMLAGRSQEETDKFWAQVESKADQFVNDKGEFVLQNAAPLAVGEK